MLTDSTERHEMLIQVIVHSCEVIVFILQNANQAL